MRVGALLILAAAALLMARGLGHAADSAILRNDHPPEADTMPSVGDADPAMRLSMAIHFATRNSAALNQLLADQQNPASPEFHHWLKPGEFDNRFGATQSDLDAVAQWLTSEGFTVQSTAGGYVQFSGTVAQAEHAFATRIKRFGDGKTYANIDDPSIPNRFAGVIANISGLDNMIHAEPVGPRVRTMP